MSLTTFTTDKLKAFVTTLRIQRIGLASPVREYVLEGDEYMTSIADRCGLNDMLMAAEHELHSRGN
jgi:hypothetical protein